MAVSLFFAILAQAPREIGEHIEEHEGDGNQRADVFENEAVHDE